MVKNWKKETNYDISSVFENARWYVDILRECLIHYLFIDNIGIKKYQRYSILILTSRCPVTQGLVLQTYYK